jgi:hypothetical protein
MQNKTIIQKLMHAVIFHIFFKNGHKDIMHCLKLESHITVQRNMFQQHNIMLTFPYIIHVHSLS